MLFALKNKGVPQNDYAFRVLKRRYHLRLICLYLKRSEVFLQDFSMHKEGRQISNRMFLGTILNNETRLLESKSNYLRPIYQYIDE